MSSSKQIPDWLLERVAIGEVPAEQRERVSEWRASSAAQARLDALAASNRDILAAYPPARVAAEVERRSSGDGPARRAPSPWLWGGAGAAVVASAAVLVLFLSSSASSTAPGDGASSGLVGGAPGESGERIKSGEPYLRIHRQLARGTEPMSHRQLVHPGDRLQLAYVPLGMKHGVILSFDGRGQVTLHYPDSRAADTSLADGKPLVYLADSYQLDDAPEFERFFFVTSPHAIDVEAVRRAAAQLASQPRRAQDAKLDLASEQRQSSFLLRKSPR